jgi:hypothetical protein
MANLTNGGGLPGLPASQSNQIVLHTSSDTTSIALARFVNRLAEAKQLHRSRERADNLRGALLSESAAYRLVKDLGLSDGYARSYWRGVHEMQDLLRGRKSRFYAPIRQADDDEVPAGKKRRRPLEPITIWMVRLPAVIAGEAWHTLHEVGKKSYEDCFRQLIIDVEGRLPNGRTIDDVFPGRTDRGNPQRDHSASVEKSASDQRIDLAIDRLIDYRTAFEHAEIPKGPKGYLDLMYRAWLTSLQTPGDEPLTAHLQWIYSRAVREIASTCPL